METNIEIMPDNIRYGIFLNGGIDSAILFYLMAKYLKSQFLVYTVVRANDGQDNELNAKNVVGWVKEKTDCSIIAHEIAHVKNKTEARANKEKQVKLLTNTFNLNAWSNGFSLNPIDPEFLTEERDVHRDYPGRPFKNIIFNNIQSYSPLSKINKKDIAKLCVKHNLEELVKLTVSCETMHPPRPCKKCWWCNEKVWAFGYY